jgi:3-oxoacyl-[acyl-carrier protein] reductase
MQLENKVAIITGGGSGIGTAYCERFLAEGAKVMIADIGQEQGRATAEKLAGSGEIAFHHTDISNEDSVRACIAATVERFGTIDILLNNAAIYGDYNPLDNSLAYVKQVFDVNVHGQWLMAKHVAPIMVEKRRGRIINIASIASFIHQLGAFATDPNNFELGGYAYQHSKFSVIGLTRHMAGQLGQFGVTANCIAPGLVMTEATEVQVPADFQPMFAEMSATKSNTQPEDMVGPAVFFAGDDSHMVNGQLLCVDGGSIMPV